MESQENFGESLEAFEVAKLIKKYTQIGYEIVDDGYLIQYKDWREHKDWPKYKDLLEYLGSRHFRLIPDLHIINKETQDEIIFEIKSKYSYNEETIRTISAKKAYYSNFFPNARFVLVLAKEERPIFFEGEIIKKLLLDFIKSNYKEKFTEFFSENNTELEEVDYFECSSIDFEDFTNIKLQGQANLKFWMEVNDETFKGKRLADGITFNFDLKMKFEPNKTALYRIDKQSSKINFDFS